MLMVMIQGAVVKQLKKDGAAAELIDAELTKLKGLRATLEAAKSAAAPSNEKPFNRSSKLFGGRTLLPSYDVFS